MAKVLQANLNHCADAQDLLIQSMAQWGVGLAIAAEPYTVPNRPNWAGDTNGLVAIIWRHLPAARPFSFMENGAGWVACSWGELIVVGCYESPNSGIAAFEHLLDGVGDFLSRHQPRPAMVLGDFNAKSTAWGSPGTDLRGGTLGDWAADHGLLVLNQGSEHTCVRQRGGSIVDITLATPAVARMVSGWEVLVGVETMSDHRYIRMAVSAPPDEARHHRRRDDVAPPRWALRRLDGDALLAAALAVAWPETPAGPLTAEEGADWFRGVMTRICDAGMPRARAATPRRQVYWWTQDVAEKRQLCVRARRQYTRVRRAQPADEARAALLYGAYREARGSLQEAIGKAKAQAREELLQTIDRDPWGRPYRMVMGKLRPWAPPVTESLDPQVLGDVVDTLFPVVPGVPRPPDNSADSPDWSAELGVSKEELDRAIKRLRARDRAPGPDGVPGRAWVMALSVLGDRLRQVFDTCLRTGMFPPGWRVARMVLLHKEGRPADSPSAYRPICLLDEAGKLFERVLAARLTRHLSRRGPDLAATQFGFREGRSTIDAIERVRSLSEEAVSQGRVVVAVSLDISNAFNTLPWDLVRRALERHRVPPYLRRVVGDYLRDRWIEYPGRYGVMQRREVHCGVPQGSVLGPLLWNIGYNAVLRAWLPAGVSVTCYADDTLVMASGEDWEEAIRAANVGTQLVVERIRALGLKVALHKTEAMWFHAPRRRPPRSHLTVGEARVEVRSQMKYLGLILDSHWRFDRHFDRLAPRVMGVAGALSRLLPNLGGPRDRVRRLYMGVVRSVALYGAPVWARGPGVSAHNATVLRRVGRRLAIRVARGYRTISADAADIVAGAPPLDILAGVYAAVYHRRVALRRQGADPATIAVDDLRRQAWRSAMRKWQRRLSVTAAAGQRTVGAVLPCLEAWRGRGWGGLTYRLTQVLTGHGCFGEYLCRIGREPTTSCHHCAAALDTAQHTLEECPAWAGERCVLRAAVGRDLSLPAIVQAMVRSERSWTAVASFCEQVMLQKEAAEREREEEALAQAQGRGGAGAVGPFRAPTRPRRRAPRQPP